VVAGLFTIHVLLVLLVGLPAVLYAIVVRNDLARRWERLRGLAANVVALRQRRQGVQGTLTRHLTGAQRHEQRVLRYGSQRGRGNGRLMADIANGWPTAGVTGVTGQALSVDTQSRDSETAARLALHQEAEVYNQLVRSWPRSVVARACGFELWRFKGSGRRHQGRFSRRRCR
jgi:hypothetical protein